MQQTFPLAEYNLKRNPFGKVSWKDWPTVIVAELDTWFAHLQQPKSALQIIGEGGRGKSTHLRTLHRSFQEATYTYVPPDRTVTIPNEPRLFIDESQRLSWWQRERIFRRATSVALATHAYHTSQLRRLGYHVLTYEVKGLALEKLQAITHKRMEWARARPGPLPYIPQSCLEYLLNTHQDNLRAIERELYEVFQHKRTTGHVFFVFEN